MNVQETSDEYVALSADIKEKASVLAALRKNLKKLDALLLDAMCKANLSEVTARGGVVITRTGKLKVKGENE